MNVPADSLIQLQAVKKIFYTDEVETHALAGIYMDIKKGEYVAIAGPSGCGKSTLLSTLGLLDSPTEGDYWLNGQSVAELPLSARARTRNREIGFIFQSFNLIGDLTVFENVELPLTYRGLKASERRDRVGAALEQVGMATGPSICRASSRAVSSSAWPSPAPLGESRPSCWPTSRRETSTPATVSRSWNCSANCTAKAPPSVWSRTTRDTRATPIAAFISSTGRSSRRASRSASNSPWCKSRLAPRPLLRLRRSRGRPEGGARRGNTGSIRPVVENAKRRPCRDASAVECSETFTTGC